MNEIRINITILKLKKSNEIMGNYFQNILIVSRSGICKRRDVCLVTNIKNMLASLARETAKMGLQMSKPYIKDMPIETMSSFHKLYIH